jgi:hypothetical protein
MKKIVAILSVASLFAAVSVSAQQAPVKDTVVIGGGVVPQLCSIDSVNEGTLKLATPSKLVTDKVGKVNVTCNTTTSKLDIKVNEGNSVLRNGTASVNFNGGTGAYAGATGTSVSPGAAVVNKSANVEATIDSGAVPLESSFNKPNYNVTVDATLTP